MQTQIETYAIALFYFAMFADSENSGAGYLYSEWQRENNAVALFDQPITPVRPIDANTDIIATYSPSKPYFHVQDNGDLVQIEPWVFTSPTVQTARAVGVIGSRPGETYNVWAVNISAYGGPAPFQVPTVEFGNGQDLTIDGLIINMPLLHSPFY